MAKAPEAPKDAYREEEVPHDKAYPAGVERPYEVARVKEEDEAK